MKLHRNLATEIVASLHQIMEHGHIPDRVLENLFHRQPRWGARDRRLVAETLYDCVRWWRLYRESADCPEPPAEQTCWKVLGTYRLLKNLDLPAWNEFEGLDAKNIQERHRRASAVRAVRESIPDWLDRYGEEQLGGAWDRELPHLNRPAPIVIRANTLKTTRDNLARCLATEGIETQNVPGAPDALHVFDQTKVFKVAAFRQGHFEAQDAGSQQIAPMLDVQPGMRIIDACAGAGGKALHLAALTQNKGTIIALDVDRRRLEELSHRARRAGATNIQPRLIDNTKTIKRLAATADRLLLDVPCTGIGAWRRNPGAKWKLTPEIIDRLVEQQSRILETYRIMLREGGKLVYATCSLFPAENEHQVEHFLSVHGSDYSLLQQRIIYPSAYGYDGFFISLLSKHHHLQE
jgi:16S rRNA (cytosine967-C5)-methyltransferase